MVAVLGCVAVGGSGACAGDSGGDDPATALADRVRAVLTTDADGEAAIVARLEELGVDAGAEDLAEAPVTCPEVDDPGDGDRATCTVTLGSRRVQLDVEFGADDAISVVRVAVAP